MKTSIKMGVSFDLIPITNSKHKLVREIYADAIYSQGLEFYNHDQMDAWAALAYLPGVLDRTLSEGKGWLVQIGNNTEAFAVRFPSNRLALLYCRGRSSRKGFATHLLSKIEHDARQEGIRTLYTEASFFSYPLLLKHNWIYTSMEEIKIAELAFLRYRMLKTLSL